MPENKFGSVMRPLAGLECTHSEEHKGSETKMGHHSRGDLANDEVVHLPDKLN